MTASRWTPREKRRFLKDRDEGMSYRKLAGKYDIATSTAEQYVKAFRKDLTPVAQIASAVPETETRVPLVNFNPSTLEYYRKRRGYSISGLAASARIPDWLVRAFESGERVPYTDSRGGKSPVERLARALGVTVSVLQSAPPSIHHPETASEPSEADVLRRDLARVTEMVNALCLKFGVVA